MNDSKLSLDALAEQFKSWRGSRHHVSYPKQFWEDIRQLSKQYSINQIAEALEINASFLHRKLKEKSYKFAPVHLKTFYNIVSLDFFTPFSERPITVKFQSDHEQLIQLIIALATYKQ